MSNAFVFPGQGSQSIGMLASFSEQAIVVDTFAEASDALGFDLWALTQSGPEQQLNQTDNTQPALLTASVALWRLWQSHSALQPSVLAGHSLGEYSALVCAGVLPLADAAKLVAARGRYMQQAVPAGSGKMAAIIGLDDAEIAAACEQAAESEVVSPVNYNSPGQVVIAGNAAAVERAMQACKDRGAKRALPLAVSVPSHCALMKPAAEQLKADLAQLDFNAPTIAVINNVDVQATSDTAAIKDALVRQLYNPVRWTETIESFAKQSITTVVECGAGNVLSGLNKRINRELVSLPLLDMDKFEAAISTLK
ncbi:MAG: ACP S-malonyltransferase [Gammaproteobacteria bacterium]|nr:ACP S-malonyltransferase [Gammaproteobacteria bacterium]